MDFSSLFAAGTVGVPTAGKEEGRHKTHPLLIKTSFDYIGARGFEPPAFRTRNGHATKLRYAPMAIILTEPGSL